VFDPVFIATPCLVVVVGARFRRLVLVIRVRRRIHRSAGFARRHQIAMDFGDRPDLHGQTAQTDNEDTVSDLSEKPAKVVGASRGLGYGTAIALAGAGAPMAQLALSDPAATASAYVLTGARLRAIPD
jgi:hypothetical protein